MKKIPTIFARDWDGNPTYVTREQNSECAWVFDGEGAPTVKWDGTCVRFDGSAWWARREVKHGKADPPDFVLLQEDSETGKRMGWEPVEQSSFLKYFDEALRLLAGRYEVDPDEGTYELIGPKINGNPERWPHHDLIRHGRGDTLRLIDVRTAPRDYDGLAAWLHARPYEGIVWHHTDGRMAKIKKRDFRRQETS